MGSLATLASAATPSAIAQPEFDLDAVDRKNPACARMEADLGMIRDLWGGTKTMRLARERWLPREPREKPEAYEVRLARSTFFNAFKRSVKDLVGRAFSRHVTIAEDKLPEIARPWLADIDLAGNTLEKYLKDALEEAVAYGHTNILVDMPRRPALTAADDLELRPYIRSIHARNLIGFDYTVEDGRKILTQVRWYDTISERLGTFATEEIPAIRALERRKGPDGEPIVVWGIFVKQKGKDGKEVWVVRDAGQLVGIGRIPFLQFSTNEVGFFESEPPLIDLAWENVGHWQSSSDQSHVLHVARVPILFGRAFPRADREGKAVAYEVGPNSFVNVESPEAEMKYVEHSGAAIGAGDKDIENRENRMAVLGSQLLVKKRQIAETATGEVLDADAEYSDLAVMVHREEAIAAEILKLMAEWKGVDPKTFGDGKIVTINTDFGITFQDMSTLTVLLESRKAREITQRTFLSELQRRKIIDPNLDLEAEIDATKLEGPELDGITEGDAGLFGAKGGGGNGGDGGDGGGGA